MNRFAAMALAGVLLAAGAWADNKGNETEIDGLKSRVPEAWKEKAVTGSMRVHHYVIPKAAGDENDAELIVFFFGKGGGGGVQANVTRWKSLVTPPEGKTIDDVTKVDEFKVGDVKATVADIHGTYIQKARPMDETGEKRPNYRLIGVILETPNGPYYVRFVGPAKTIEANKKGFDDWLKGFK